MTRRVVFRAAGLLACLAFLLSCPAFGQTGRTTTSRLQGLCVREAPDSSSKIVRALRAGEEATALDRKGDWILVMVSGGAKGWAYGGYLTGFGIKPPQLYASKLLPDVPPVKGEGDAVPAPPATETPSRAQAAPTAKAEPSKAAPAASAVPGAPETAQPPAATEPATAAPAAATESARAALDALVAKAASAGAKNASQKSALPVSLTLASGRYRIEIYLTEHRLYLFEKLSDGGRRLVRDYEVATPGGDVAAPEGWGVVTGIDFNPSWVPTANMRRRAKLRGKSLPTYVAPGLKSNPMGTFKIYLSHGEGYRIHGNNNPRSIGKSVTSGCIRMRNDEGADMARMIDVGSEVVFF